MLCWTVSTLTALLGAASGAAGLGGAQGWPVAPYAVPPYSAYPQDYDDEYYYLPKPVVRYPYYAPLSPYEPEAYRTAYPYYYKPFAPYPEPEDPVRLEERAAREAALPVGQETWYESEPPTPRWRQAGLDDVNAAFLQNLIISQMARNADHHTRAEAPQHVSEVEEHSGEEDAYGDRGTSDLEDEDVRELKALAGKPLYHSAKTEPHEPAPTNRYEYYDYPSDDSFINWGSKRSDRSTERPAELTSTAPPSTHFPAVAGQQEFVMLRPATPVRHPFSEPVMQMLKSEWRHEKRSDSVYDKIKQILATEKNKANAKIGVVADGSRLKKRFVSSDEDLVSELRGLKRRIVT